jgi:hypothetical protein
MHARPQRLGASTCIAKPYTQPTFSPPAPVLDRDASPASGCRAASHLLPRRRRAAEWLERRQRHDPRRDRRAEVFGAEGPQWHVLPLLDISAATARRGTVPQGARAQEDLKLPAGGPKAIIHTGRVAAARAAASAMRRTHRADQSFSSVRPKM